MTRRVIADRLLLVDTVDRWFHLDGPTFVDVGQVYWIDRATDELCVDRGDGRVSRHVGAMCR